MGRGGGLLSCNGGGSRACAGASTATRCWRCSFWPAWTGAGEQGSSKEGACTPRCQAPSNCASPAACLPQALICGLPMVLNAFVPCQEEGNIPYVVDNKVRHTHSKGSWLSMWPAASTRASTQAASSSSYRPCWPALNADAACSHPRMAVPRSSRAGGAARCAPGVAALYPHTKYARPPPHTQPTLPHLIPPRPARWASLSATPPRPPSSSASG